MEAQIKRTKKYPYTFAVTTIFCWAAHGSYYTNGQFFIAVQNRNPDSLVGQLSMTQMFGWLGDLLYEPWLFGILVTVAMCGTVYMAANLWKIEGYFCLLLAAGLITSNRFMLAAHLYWPHETAFSLFFALFSIWVWKRKGMGITKKYTLCILSLSLFRMCGSACIQMIPFAVGSVLLKDLFTENSPVNTLIEAIEYAVLFWLGKQMERVLLSFLEFLCQAELSASYMFPADDLPTFQHHISIDLLLYALFGAATLLLLAIFYRRCIRFSNTLQMLVAEALLVLLAVAGVFFWNKGQPAFLKGIVQPAVILMVAVLDHTNPNQNKDIPLNDWLKMGIVRYQTGPSEQDDKEFLMIPETPLSLWNWKKLILSEFLSLFMFFTGCVLAGTELIRHKSMSPWIVVVSAGCMLFLSRFELRINKDVYSINGYSKAQIRAVKCLPEKLTEKLLGGLLLLILLFSVVLSNSAYLL